MWSKLKLAIWFRIMRFHLDMRLCIIDPVLMSFDDGTGPAPEVLKILLLKKNDQRQLERTSCRVCYLGSHPERKVQFFFNIVQKAFDPPPPFV